MYLNSRNSPIPITPPHLITINRLSSACIRENILRWFLTATNVQYFRVKFGMHYRGVLGADCVYYNNKWYEINTFGNLYVIDIIKVTDELSIHYNNLIQREESAKKLIIGAIMLREHLIPDICNHIVTFNGL